MPSSYSIVRYVPDPIADERINVGVVVFGEGALKTRFVRTWSRVKRFGAEDPGFLRDFAEEISNPQHALFDSASLPWTEETLRRVSRRWTNSIQLSEPRASLKDPDALLCEVASRFLREGSPPRARGRDKRTAVSLAAQSVSRALQRRGIADPSNLLKRKGTVAGREEEHVFDLVVENGHPFFAAEGLSFEGVDSEALRNEISALAWAVDDVRKETRGLPVAVLALPPKRESAAFRRAQHVFTGLRADFIPESDFAKWAELMAKKVPTKIT